SNERFNILEADVYMCLGEETENLYKKLVFFMAATEAYSRNDTYECTYAMFKVSKILGSSSLYKRVLKTAELFLKRIDSILESKEPGVTEDGVYACLFDEQRKLRELSRLL